jgi:hypothetical protein
VALNATFIATATAAAVVPALEGAMRGYRRLLSAAADHRATVHFRLQSRKLLVHSADHTERAARRFLGDAASSAIQVRCP